MWAVLAILCLSAIIIILIGIYFGNRIRVLSTKPEKSGDKAAAYTIFLFLRNNEEQLEWVVRRLMLLRYGNYQPFEIVLVDRGSSDRTPEIATLLQRDYPNLKVIKDNGLVLSDKSIVPWATGRVIIMEELAGQYNCALVLERVRNYLRKKEIGGLWDHSPIKIETTEECTQNRHNDTM